MMGGVENVAFRKGIQISVKIPDGGPEHKRTLQGDICKWENNIKMDLEKLGWKVWTGFILFTTGFGSQILW
jgi:hypothetical protein